MWTQVRLFLSLIFFTWLSSLLHEMKSYSPSSFTPACPRPASWIQLRSEPVTTLWKAIKKKNFSSQILFEIQLIIAFIFSSLFSFVGLLMRNPISSVRVSQFLHRLLSSTYYHYSCNLFLIFTIVVILKWAIVFIPIHNDNSHHVIALTDNWRDDK